MVQSVQAGRDGKTRKVKVKYRNHNENFNRETYRSARSLIVIRHMDESNVMEELGEVARFIDNKMRLTSNSKM